METKKFAVGSKVRVTDWGYEYTTNADYLKGIKDSLDIEILIRYAYGDNSHYCDSKQRYGDRNTYIVLYADHVQEKALIALPGSYTSVYLIKYDGLSFAPIDLTKSQIEDLLGFPINIIEESTDGG